MALLSAAPLLLRDFLLLVGWLSLSRKVEKPTVPLVLSGPRFEKSSWPDRRFIAGEVVCGLGGAMTPIFCS
jgi:hypothetical protein